MKRTIFYRKYINFFVDIRRKFAHNENIDIKEICMCTAVSFKTKDCYFGRNLDYEFSYEESIVITPRNYEFSFRNQRILSHHYAIIGMAFVQENYPLYYDAMNEMGLAIAGLNFPGNAFYFPRKKGKDNIGSFELIPWILSQCKSIKEVEKLLSKLNICDLNFNDQLKASPLHFMVTDKEENSLVIESVKEGLKIYKNPVGVLTNNPPFDYHLLHLAQYMSVTSKEVKNDFSDKIELIPFSRGMGSIGLPGDLSSPSRFIKASFTKLNSKCDDSESASIAQFFHILNSVAQQKGCCQVGEKYEYTIYSSCCNLNKGLYYYTTYENSQITCVNMHHYDLNESKLCCMPMQKKLNICEQF